MKNKSAMIELLNENITDITPTNTTNPITQLLFSTNLFNYAELHLFILKYQLDMNNKLTENINYNHKI